MDNLSIYVHIPFCESKCYYCDFVSGNYSNQVKEEYVNALVNEIQKYRINAKINSIYFGGGTPSCLTSSQIEKIFVAIKNNFQIENNAEITIEANPNSLTNEKLLKYKNLGFNRLSLGVQTTNKKSLKFIGRIINKKLLKNYKKTVKKCLKNAKKIGFNNISADLMLGLPYNNIKNLKKDLKFLCKNVSHISTYMLMVEENTKLFQKIKSFNKIEENSLKEYDFVVKYLANKQFIRYEISNFCKENFNSCHNENYWNQGEYIGFGLAAHSHIKPYRYYNITDIKKYVTKNKISTNVNIENKNQFVNLIKNDNSKIVEKLNKDDYAKERVMLSLRTIEGLDVSNFKNEFYDILTQKSEEIEELLRLKLIYGLPNNIKLTNEGFKVANQIIMKLI